MKCDLYLFHRFNLKTRLWEPVTVTSTENPDYLYGHVLGLYRVRTYIKKVCCFSFNEIFKFLKNIIYCFQSIKNTI